MVKNADFFKLDKKVSEWVSFLMLISVEITSDYLTELNLPFSKLEFCKIITLSRACLEIYLSYKVKNPQISIGYDWCMPTYWYDYRDFNGVLSDDELKYYCNKYHFLTKLNQYLAWEFSTAYAYLDLNHYVEFETTLKLEDWFFSNLRFLKHEYSFFTSYTMDKIFNNQKKYEYKSPFPLSKEEFEIIREYYIYFKYHQRKEYEYWRMIGIDLSNEKPTKWESVIQTFPIDSKLHGRQLPLYFKSSIIFQLAKKCFEFIKNNLGETNTNIFISWIYKETDY